MRANLVKESMTAGKPVINAWAAIPSGISAEILALQDFDSVTIDMQHGLVDYQAMLTMLQAISQTETTPIVRVPWLEHGIIMKSLDAGAMGIICPMVNTPEDAEKFVQICSYAPRGVRSFGPTRAINYAGADYFKHANEAVLKLAMIETTEAYNNRDAIMATEGVDGVYIGPSDLGLSMGFVPKLDRDEPELMEAIFAIRDAAKKHGKFACIHCLAPEYAKSMHDEGFDLVTMASDGRLMAAACAEGIATVRSGKAKEVAGQY